MATVGIIGGSGLYQMDGIEVMEEQTIFTPFGEPSGNYIVGHLNSIDVVFLPRHGKSHKISPTEINYRANIYGMKKFGVDAIISVSACGSLKEGIEPLHFVLPTQFIDWTRHRKSTFFEEGVVAHVPFADPVSPEVRQALLESCQEVGVTFHDGGTYITIEGPQFSTKAESNLYRSWGVDIIGMTNATEAKLAREAEISYATLAAVTDYDCWHESRESVTVEMIIDNLNKNVDNAKKILKAAIPKIAAIENFSAEGAMKYAVITQRDKISLEKKKILKPLIGEYLGEE